MTPLVLDPLTAPYDRAAAAALAKRLRAEGPTGPKFDLQGSAKNLNVVVIVAAIALTLFTVLVSAVIGWVRGGGPLELVPIMSSVIPYGALVALIVFLVVRVLLPRLAVSQTWWRLSQFATVNGLRFAPWTTSFSYASPLFASGAGRALQNHISGEGFDLGTLSFQIGARGTGARTSRLGYVAIKLDRALPHIVLEAKGGPATYISYDRSQRLSLEGDFDNHFTLYCPAEYERDALYIFTPDLMALLIDEAATFDVEIVDGWMFAAAPRELDLTDPGVMQRMFRIIDVVGAKASSRVARYVDDRAPVIPPTLVRAPRFAANSRLRSPQVIAAIAVGVLALLWTAVAVLTSVLR